MRKVEVREYNGSPAIIVDGKACPPMMINIWTNTEDNKDVVLKEDYYKGLAAGGIKTFFISCNTEWINPNAFNLFKKETELLIKYVKDANIILRIALHPSNEWIKANPEECFTINTGETPEVEIAGDCYRTTMPHQYSLASSKWREDAGKYLLSFLNKAEKLSHFDRIIGVFFVAGHTSEWYHNIYADKENYYGEFSEAFKRAFTKFLKDKYTTQENLRKHWKSDIVTFDNPYIPQGKYRYFAKKIDADIMGDARNIDFLGPEKYLKGSNIGHFLDIDKHQDLMDYYLAFDNSIAQSQIYLAKLIKDSYKGNLLTGAFFGSYGWTDFLDSGTCAGVIEIIKSGYMDILAAPGDYRNRQPGGFTGQREMQDAFRLRGKIFFIEEDTRTHLEKPFYKNLFDYYTIQDTCNILKRDFGRNICEDTNAWWLDQHNYENFGNDGGRYRHNIIYSIFARQQELAVKFYEMSRTKGNEIALIYDEESTKVISNASTKALIPYFRDYELARIGAGVDQYYHDDMSLSNMPDYKLYVFFNTFVLNDSERKAILTKLQKNNATAIWIYAPGIINPDYDPKFDVENMNQLTGFDFAMEMGVFNPKYKFNNIHHPISQGLDPHKLFGYESSPYYNNIVMGSGQPVHYNFPLFYIKDKDAEILANYAESGHPAVAFKRADGYNSLYHGSKIISHELVRSVAKYAGCHIYSDNDNVVYASDSFLTVHASYSGECKIKFKELTSPYEVYEKKFYGEGVTEISFKIYFGETKMFSLNGLL